MLKFDEGKHVYTWNEKVVPSVTQILSRVGVRSREDSHWNSISGSEFIHDNTAAEFGTAFHDVAQYIVQGIKCSYDPALEPWVVGLKKYIEEHMLLYRDIKVEKPLYSKKYGYAGTYDLFAFNKEIPVLDDWKTSTQFQKHWRLQTVAYEQLIRENYGIKKRMSRKCVRVYEYGYEARDYKKNWATDWNDFLSILNVYKKFSK